MTEAWCILRTSGARTLTLARSLQEAGFEAWTPVKVDRRRPLHHGSQKLAGRVREIERPILPTFVFVRADQIVALTMVSADPLKQHPDFSVFRRGDEAPVIGERSLAGLRLAEREATELIQAIRDAEDREAARQARAAILRTQAARRKAMRATGKALVAGAEVELRASAFTGLKGTVLTSTDRTTKVDFGHGLAWTVETWQVLPSALYAPAVAA